MKVAPIIWTSRLDSVPDGKGNKVYTYEGRVNGTFLFAIDRKNVKEPIYVLKAYPFESGVFTRANNSKVLFEDTNPDKVKRVAEVSLQSFVSMFTVPGKSKIKQQDLGTLVLMSKYHVQANKQFDGSTNDIDTVIELSAKFDKVFEGVNWEEHDTPWDDAVALFYNANKPHNWNGIEFITLD